MKPVADDLTTLRAKSILIDGYQFTLATALIHFAKTNRVPTVIDADAVRPHEHVALG